MSLNDDSTLMVMLGELLGLPPKSVEILPDDAHQWISKSDASISTKPFLFEEQNLGVPRKALHKSYLTAISVFTTAKKEFIGKKSLCSTVDDLLVSSIVILLASPAHQTALNVRKRLIQNGFLNPERELAIIGALQSARDCAKEAILWDHRRWLFRFLYGQVQVGSSLPNDHASADGPHRDSEVLHIPPKTIQAEFARLAYANEIYPRNYYAWTHWDFCVNILFTWLHSDSTITFDDKHRLVSIIKHENLRLRRWVELHVSDHSAVHHLCGLVRRFLSHSFREVLSFDFVAMDPASTFEHALSLVTAYPTHESLWLYLRAAVYFPENQRHARILRFISSMDFRDRIALQLACRNLAWWAHQDGQLRINDVSARKVISSQLV